MSTILGSYRLAEDWLRFLVDEGSFLPLHPEPSTVKAFGREIITGLGKIGGKDVALWANRSDVNQGYVTSQGAIKIRRLMDRALELGIPVISLLSSAGVSIEEGVKSGEEYSRVMMGTVELSGQVPQIAMVMGVNIGASAYSAALQDLVLFNKTRSHLCVSGPGVVKQVLSEDTTFTSLGGVGLHSTETGLAHFVDATVELQLQRCQWLISFLPSNNREDPPLKPSSPPTAPLPEIPAGPQIAFDMNQLVLALVDRSEAMEYSPQFGPSMLCHFARIEGQAVGLISSQSLHLSGALDCDASTKMARFIRICDAYNIPTITLIDSPGFLPGSAQEKKGILQSGAELIYAMRTRTPKLSVVVRKCYGAAAIVLSQTRSWNGDLVLALTTASNAVMGFEAAREVMYRNDPRSEAEQRADYRTKHEDPSVAMSLGLIDEVVAPDQLRARLGQHLLLLRRKRQPPQPRTRVIGP